MINKLYKNITAGLKEIKTCKVYMEDVPQNFKKPSFSISFYDQSPSKGINSRLKNTVRVDVSYFPEDRQEVNDECWEIGQSLTRNFKIEGFKIKNRNLKITDKVLHFMFDVDYREFLPDDTPAMQELTQNTDMKEE